MSWWVMSKVAFLLVQHGGLETICSRTELVILTGYRPMASSMSQSSQRLHSTIQMGLQVCSFHHDMEGSQSGGMQTGMSRVQCWLVCLVWSWGCGQLSADGVPESRPSDDDSSEMEDIRTPVCPRARWNKVGSSVAKTRHCGNRWAHSR